MTDFFKRNRNKLFNILEDGQGVVLFAGQAPRKRGDENYPFTPDRNFYYMTGIDREHFIFFMYKKNNCRYEQIYIEPDNGQQAKWIGETLTPLQVKELSGIEDIRFIDEFYDDFGELGLERLYLDYDRRDLKESEEKEFFQAENENISLMNVFHKISEFRVIKEPEEIAWIEKAIDITADAIRAMMKNTRDGMMEYEIEAHYDFVLKQNGVQDKAFQTICAGGKNATVLHYMDNNSPVRDGDLVLVDAGAQFKYYNGDLSRTFPVSGKFTDRQKTVYNIVLRAQEYIIDMMKPGIPMPMLNEAVKDFYYQELKKIGLAETKEDVFRYYYHNIGHFLGAETHDVGDRSQNLKAGMVITVEPGLYIEEWNIGIRIEDDILITEDGYRNLSAGLPKTIEEIEAFMAR